MWNITNRIGERHMPKKQLAGEFKSKRQEAQAEKELVEKVITRLPVAHAETELEVANTKGRNIHEQPPNYPGSCKTAWG